MDYNFDVASTEDNNILFASYYEYFTRLYGESFWSNVCRVAITNERFDSRALSFMDDAYAHTKTTMDANSGEGPKIISMKTKDGNNIGFFRVRFLTVDDTNLACVAELVLPNDLEGDRVEALKDMIGAIEQEVIANCLEVEGLDFEAGLWDREMQTALVDAGFSLVNADGSRNNITCMYEKLIRTEKTTRE